MNIAIPVIVILLILIWRLYNSYIKGVIGEKTIATILSFLNKKKYKVINNIVLQPDKNTAQIDHVIISDFGIFVIETKNYKGRIVGNENSEYWTQVIFSRKEKFYNPIRQNLGHIRVLKKSLVEYPHIDYKSIIVFSSKANIKVNTVENVVYSYQLLKKIKQYTEINLSEIDKQNIYNKIQASNLSDTFDKRKHVKTIKQSIRKREASINANKCPQCSADLITRTGKYGDFLGCKSYPFCKFSRKV